MNPSRKQKSGSGVARQDGGFCAAVEDILTEPATEILRTKVLLTVLGGKETHGSSEL